MLCVLHLSTQFLMKNHQKYHSYETLVLIFTAFLTSLPFVPLIYFFSFSCCKAKKSHLTDLDTLAAVERNYRGKLYNSGTKCLNSTERQPLE